MPISLYTTQELIREAQQPAEAMSPRLRRCCDAHTPPGAKLESCFWRGGFRLFLVYRYPGLKKPNFHEIKGSSFSNHRAMVHESVFAASYVRLARKSMFADIFSNDRPATAWKDAVIPGMGKRVPGFKMEGDQPRHDEEITKIYHVASEIVFPKSSRPTSETQARIDKMLNHGRKAMQDKMDQLVVEALVGATIVGPLLGDEPDRWPGVSWSCNGCGIEFDGEKPFAEKAYCAYCKATIGIDTE